MFFIENMKNENAKAASHGLKVRVSKYISYLLRHNPYEMQMDKHGFVSFDELFEIVRARFHINKKLIHEKYIEIIEQLATKIL